ncbi:hypothetical protein [Microbacterium sp. BLY]|uniref:hypothetical protein n=1 Tax=Microbacterium sp. BLY TaxID=2823280 RepID=UPI001B3302A0|nr:hypothetical protein [Microbacterium sp. BLY]MBP3977382.1 hypothetical protein [Microbacterium sp. BLY]
MTDLDVQRDALDAAKARLTAAGAPVITSCLSFGGIGSPAVESALGEAEALVTQILTALGQTAANSAADAAGVASTWTASDDALAEAAR